jgi:ribosome biogenesis GTPase A
MRAQVIKAIGRIPPFPWQGTVNWFPGHMNKAIKNIQSSLKLVDTIIEVRDARVSSNIQ